MSEHPLVTAARKGKVQDVQQLIAEGFDANVAIAPLDANEQKAAKWVLTQAGVESAAEMLGRVADVTPLLRVSSHSGMLSSVTGFGPGAETLRTVQSAPSVPRTVRQTGSLNVTVAMLPETARAVKVGRVTSVYV